ncbi:MAG: polyamine ABC transporter substrate-binding protein [Geminicoccaceae bacterium]
MKLKTAVAATLTAIPLLVTSAVAEEEAVLNIYNWSDYIAEDTITKFEEQTGIKVNYDVFDSNEVLEAKMLAGGSGYDVVVPSSSFLARQIVAGVFQPLDTSKLANIGNLDPAISELVAGHDPGNEHSISYLWGTTGIGYNKPAIEERMPDAPLDSWDMVLNPDIVANFADCGVSMLDAPSEMVSATLHYLGLDPTSEDKADLAKAEEHLQKIRPHIRYFHSSQYINDLANGDICLTVGWSGDILQARDRANEAGKGVEVVYKIPTEGAMMWFDMLAIPVDAPHPENAHKFIDFLMDAEIMADITSYVSFASGNAASMAYVSEDVLNDEAVHPSKDVIAKLYIPRVNSAKYDRIRTRAWTKVKTGQ